MLKELDPRGWALWRNRLPFVLILVAVYLAAGSALLPFQLGGLGDFERFAILALVSSLCFFCSVRMERARKFLEASRAPNFVATWTFAAALTVGHVYASVMVVTVYALQWQAERKLYAGRPHRYVFNAATVVVAVRCCQFVHNPVLAGGVLLCVNMVLVATVLVVSGRPETVLRMANVRQQGLEVVTLALGWAAAMLFQWHVVAIVTVVPVLIGIHYVALCLSIRQPTVIDAETGALTPRAWNALGALRLSQAKEAVVFQVMVSEPDAAPWVTCAEGVRGSVRPEDLIGRTSDGFSILVAGSGSELLAEMLALQMRARLAVNGIDTYVGFAVTPDRGIPVDLSGLAVTAGADAIVKVAQIRV